MNHAVYLFMGNLAVVPCSMLPERASYAVYLGYEWLSWGCYGYCWLRRVMLCCELDHGCSGCTAVAGLWLTFPEKPHAVGL